MDGYPSYIEIVSRLSAIHNQEIMDTDLTKLTQHPQTSLEHQFSRILTHYLKEWNDSCLDEKLTTLNLTFLIGFTTYEYLLYGFSQSDRQSDRQLKDKWLRSSSCLYFLIPDQENQRQTAIGFRWQYKIAHSLSFSSA